MVLARTGVWRPNPEKGYHGFWSVASSLQFHCGPLFDRLQWTQYHFGANTLARRRTRMVVIITLAHGVEAWRVPLVFGHKFFACGISSDCRVVEPHVYFITIARYFNEWRVQRITAMRC